MQTMPLFRHAFHRFHIVRAEMMHVVATVANCIMFEVLESCWSKLVTELHAAKDMDALIAAHEKYLDEIFDKVGRVRLVWVACVCPRVDSTRALTAESTVFCLLVCCAGDDGRPVDVSVGAPASCV